MESVTQTEETRQAQPYADLSRAGLWLVCFTGRADALYWWDKILFTRPDFRHCYLLQYQAEAERWVMVDWRTGVCDVVVLLHDEVNYVLNHLAGNQGTAVLVKGTMPDKEINYRVPLVYCVQAVLQVLGLPTRWTFTPYQLYKRLIKAGCEELINHRSSKDGRKQQAEIRSEPGSDQQAHSGAA